MKYLKLDTKLIELKRIIDFVNLHSRSPVIIDENLFWSITYSTGNVYFCVVDQIGKINEL